MHFPEPKSRKLFVRDYSQSKNPFTCLFNAFLGVGNSQWAKYSFSTCWYRKTQPNCLGNFLLHPKEIHDTGCLSEMLVSCNSYDKKANYFYDNQNLIISPDHCVTCITDISDKPCLQTCTSSFLPTTTCYFAKVWEQWTFFYLCS